MSGGLAVLGRKFMPCFLFGRHALPTTHTMHHTPPGANLLCCCSRCRLRSNKFPHPPTQICRQLVVWDCPLPATTLPSMVGCCLSLSTIRGSGGKKIVHMTKVSTQIHSSISQYDVYKVLSKKNDHNLTVGCLND